MPDSGALINLVLFQNSTFSGYPIMLNAPFCFKDIRIELTGDKLLIANSKIERTLDLSSGMPVTVSLKDPCAGTEYAKADKVRADFYYAGYNLPDMATEHYYKVESLEVEHVEESIFENESVRVKLHIFEPVQQLNYWREYVIYPEMPAIAAISWIESKTVPRFFSHRRAADEFNDFFNRSGKNRMVPLESCADSFLPAPEISPSMAVRFTGRTDYNNDLAFEEAVSDNEFNGNILFFEEDGKEKLWMLQEAPTSEERRDFEKYDFKINDDGNILSCCWGILPEDVRPDRKLRGYRHVIGFCDNGLRRSVAIKKYLKHRFPLDHDEGFSVMVNPWGTRHFPDRVSEQFLIDEFKAAGEISATHYQIDDGWQNGKSLARLSIDNLFPTMEDFWDINTDLLPEGFKNIIAAAKEAGVEPALWVAPSVTKEYRDHEDFAEMVWKKHKEFGFRMFKIDAMRTKTKESEDNIEKLLRGLRERSNGKIYFNLDTTNGMRPCYFMFLEYGNLFIENRYGSGLMPCPYHPESTLRNFWRLSRYVRAQVMQFEFADPQTINKEYYEENGITLPTLYDPEYWAAVPMFANPLVWLSPSLLTPELKAKFKRVIELHMKYRDEIFAGEILPVGQEPDGSAITGFQSYNFTTGNGFLIVFREIQAPETGTIELPLGVEHELNFESVSDDAPNFTKSAGTAEIEVNMPSPGSFRLYRYY